MNATDPTRATLDERYSAAGNSHNLTSTPEHQTQADVLGASGMSRSPVGATLQRLQGEWDGATKTPGASAAELCALMSRLHSLPAALFAVRDIARKERINPSFAPEVLLWWLDPGCPACGGHGTQPLHSGSARSLRRCPACHGTRMKPVPFGRAGDRITDRMEEALNNWRGLTARRLHNTGKAE